MDGHIIPILLGLLIGLITGFLIAKSLEKMKVSKLIKLTNKEAVSIIKEAKVDAESLKKDKILQAKERFIELKYEHEKVIFHKNKKISEAEKRVRYKELKASSELDRNKKLNRSLESKEKDFEYKLDFFRKERIRSRKSA